MTNVHQQASWERATNGVAAGIAASSRAVTITPYRSRRLASAKMTEVALISAEFRGVPAVFEPWLMVLLDTGEGLEFAGIYKPAFSAAEHSGTAAVPAFSLRTAVWQAAQDSERLGDEAAAIGYVTGPEHAPAITRFVTRTTIPDLIALVDELTRVCHRGLAFQSVERPAPALHELRIQLFDTRVHLTCSYTGFRTQSKSLEDWVERWRGAVADVASRSAPGADMCPDGGWRISYRHSLAEQLRSLDKTAPAT
jgi:hypothetical protein